jgi:hypothetical protein
MTHDLETVRFNVLRNALYQTARRMSFERLNRWFSFFVIILGAAAMVELVTGFGVPAVLPSAMVTAIGALQLTFDFGGKARQHHDLQRQYYNLLADIEQTVDPDVAQIAHWYGSMIRIAGDEAPILRAIDAKAYNDAVDAMEMDRQLRLQIPWHHRVLQGVLTFEGHTYRKLSELQAPRSG